MDIKKIFLYFEENEVGDCEEAFRAAFNHILIWFILSHIIIITTVLILKFGNYPIILTFGHPFFKYVYIIVYMLMFTELIVFKAKRYSCEMSAVQFTAFITLQVVLIVNLILSNLRMSIRLCKNANFINGGEGVHILEQNQNGNQNPEENTTLTRSWQGA